MREEKHHEAVLGSCTKSASTEYFQSSFLKLWQHTEHGAFEKGKNKNRSERNWGKLK